VKSFKTLFFSFNFFIRGTFSFYKFKKENYTKLSADLHICGIIFSQMLNPYSGFIRILKPRPRLTQERVCGVAQLLLLKAQPQDLLRFHA